MREICKSGSEGGARQTNVSFLPLSGAARAAARIDFWEGQRPRLTQISSTASSPISLGASSVAARL
jgi:hypothetical protein